MKWMKWHLGVRVDDANTKNLCFGLDMTVASYMSFRRPPPLTKHTIYLPLSYSIIYSWRLSITLIIAHNIASHKSLTCAEFQSQGCFDEHFAARIIKSLLEAVAYLHANGIVHRDIKPENILFETQEEDSPIKLIDFGLSRRHVQGMEPNLTNPVGTPYYMSNECLECNYSAPTDTWSIGIITYILLCGYAPFSGDDDYEIFQAIMVGNLDFPPSEWVSKSPLCSTL